MEVIRQLGQRVEKEHDQFLRDSQRLEDCSTVATDGRPGVDGTAVSADFESLVGKANGVKVDTTLNANTPWDDDVWGSIFNSSTVGLAFIGLDMDVADITTNSLP
jgi:SCY1-like protein 2